MRVQCVLLQRHPFKILCPVVELVPVDVIDGETVISFDKSHGYQSMHKASRSLVVLP